MAVQTEFVGGHPQLRVMACAVHIVACCAGHAMTVHHALNEIIALHTVLMRRAISEMREVGLTQRDVVKLPVVHKTKTGMTATRPVIGLSADESRTGPALRMAGNTGIVRSHVAHPGGVQYIGPRWIRYVFAARTVTAFASDIPFGGLLAVNVVIDRVAAIARRTRRTLQIVGRVIGRPPV